jgi:hypothetical protein
MALTTAAAATIRIWITVRILRHCAAGGIAGGQSEASKVFRTEVCPKSTESYAVFVLSATA